MSDNYRKLAAVVLAAGKGKRMKSDLPKVLHEVAGRPIVLHVLDTLIELEVEKTILVVGHQAERVIRAIERPGIVFVEQKELLGTGHAVMMVEEDLRSFDGDILVLLGDAPLLRASTVKMLIAEHERRDAAGTVLTAILPDPTGYGRIVRDRDGLIVKIVEHKDATVEEREIAEINSGTFVFKKAPLFEALGRIDNSNKQGEYYLTDVMQVFLESGMPTAGYCVDDHREALGVNSAEELAALDAQMRAKLS
jgi:bifunctional UDP-N-acetylglucosamine pyrophosphorylase/glucosamine-1-phosphate N-acetyltransferase